MRLHYEALNHEGRAVSGVIYAVSKEDGIAYIRSKQLFPTKMIEQNSVAIINSILDTDLYKLTMQQAVLFGRFAGIDYQSVPVTYEFINRGNTKFPVGFGDLLKQQIKGMTDLKLTKEEQKYLRSLRFFKPGYVDFLAGYRFNPDEVEVAQTGEELKVSITGPWYRTILWEVPLMAMISELYYLATNQEPKFNVAERAKEKAVVLQNNNCVFSDFGTRRRFSFTVQASVVRALKEAQPAVGTSNVFLAKHENIKCIGTHGHEWFMAHAALFGYRQANRFALDAWQAEYRGDLGIALTDTFTTDVFFRDFGRDAAKLFDGVRHDSNDPFEFAEKAIRHYQSLGIDPLSKTIVFSDGLDVARAVDIAKWCQGKIKCAFGIGTHFTNDVGVIPLNIVIKMTHCNGAVAVKLSDVFGKRTGNSSAIKACVYQLGIENEPK